MKKLLLVLLVLCIFSSLAMAQQESKETTANQPNLYVDFDATMLGAYNFFSKKGGAEVRIDIDTNWATIPLEWQYVGKELRMRAFPAIFIGKRLDKKAPSIFFTWYSESVTKNDQTANSYTEIGPGAGFTAESLKISVWLTHHFYQGDPSVKEMLNFRSRLEVNPEPFYVMFAFKLGIALAKKNVDVGGTSVDLTSSAATFSSELELGYRVWKGIRVQVGAELRTDDLGALLDGDVQEGGIDSALQFILKGGINYKF